MRRASAAFALFAMSTFVNAIPARATFHIVVVDQVFPGVELAPQAQYVMLRTQAVLQTAVYGQPLPVFDAIGTPLETFGTFCATPIQSCVLPAVSPACSAGGCPAPFDSSGGHILVATPWAEELFCVTADLVATGVLPFPNGRVCWGDCDLRPDCGSGPVDCVAYGRYSGDNAPFGSPATSPMLGEALVADPARQNQFLLAPANNPLLDDSKGFSVGAPTPENFHGDHGAIEGVAGDPEGTGMLDVSGVAAAVTVVFETNRRCSLPAARRGADANFDTRVSAADVTATVRIVTSAG
jgi:hypothetical protein